MDVYQRIDKFHAHLDICSQCRNHPFGLCSIGAKLLKEAATGQMETMEVYVGKDKGRWPKGTRVRKISSKSGDTHQDGALGTIVGALGPLTAGQRAELIIELAKKGVNGDVEYFYWVEWDDIPGVPVAITDNRLEPVDD